MIEWIKRDTTEFPSVPGLYFVMISGDSESLDGHVLYEYSDYRTTAEFDFNEGVPEFTCPHDEDQDWIFAYYGPVIIPEFEV